jgi:hypothetical protein
VKVGIDLKRLTTDRAHTIFFIDGNGAYSRAISCAECRAVFHTPSKCGSELNRILYGVPKIGLHCFTRDEGGFY